MDALRYHALLVRAPDLDLAHAFYVGKLGLSEKRLARTLIRACDTTGQCLYLEEMPLAPGPAPDQARAMAKFRVGDLKRAAADFAGHLIEPVDAALLRGRATESIRFRDPFGNVHTFLAFGGVERFREPLVHSTGIKIPIASVPAAKRLYADTLGFVTETERYYPPLLPMAHQDRSPAFTIEDKENWERDMRVRAPLYPDEIGVVMVFETPDLEGFRDELMRRTSNLRVTPGVAFPLGRRMALIDSAGLATEIWEISR